MKNKKICIVGAGNFGCAIMSALQNAGCEDITVVFKDEESLKYAKEKACHNLVAGVNFKNVKLELSLENGIKNAEIIFLAVPSEVCEDVINEIAEVKKDVKIVLCTKGLRDNFHQPFFSRFITDKIPQSKVAVLAGPSFASGMIECKKTLVSIASKDNIFLIEIGKLFEGSFLKIKTTNDVLAVQILSTLKNILAIYIGFMKAKNIDINEITAKMLNFIYDSSELFEFYNSGLGVFIEPAGIGDIVLTCFSGQSRNYKFGFDLANGNTAKKYETVEGYRNYKLLEKVLLKNKIEYNAFFEMVDEVFHA